MQKISDSTSSANAEGEFTEGSAAAGVAATLITADWLNCIQRELLGVLTKAGLSPVANDFAQLSKAIFNSPALSGNPTAPTAAQFDNDTSLATTAFVQRALGGYAGYSNYATPPTNIPVTDAGKYCIINTVGVGNTAIPDPSTLPSGVTFTLEAIGADIVVTCVNANSASFSGPAMQVNAASYRLLNANFVQFVVINGQYRVTTGGGKAQLATPGWQKLESGLIVQWGGATTASGAANVTFPIAFPNGCLGVNLSEAAASAWSATNLGVAGTHSRTTTGFSIRSVTYNTSWTLASGTYFWIAIGY